MPLATAVPLGRSGDAFCFEKETLQCPSGRPRAPHTIRTSPFHFVHSFE